MRLIYIAGCGPYFYCKPESAMGSMSYIRHARRINRLIRWGILPEPHCHLCDEGRMRDYRATVPRRADIKRLAWPLKPGID